MTEKTIVFQPMGRRVLNDEHSSLLELAQQGGVKIESACGGKGQCGKCKVQVWGKASSIETQDSDALGPNEADGYCLACQTRVKGAAAVWVPETSRLHKQDILTTGHEFNMDFAPDVKSFELEVPVPKLNAVVADRERVFAQLSRSAGVDPQFPWQTSLAVLRGLEEKLRSDSGRVSVVATSEGRIMDFSYGWGKDCLGLAVDLGTTTIVVYLIDLKTGRIMSTKADMNPQVSQGEDVISRISSCRDNSDQLDRLGSLARECINDLAQDACDEVGADIDRVFQCVVVGNTAMHHFFLGLNPGNLGRSPYTPVASGSLEVSAREVGLGVSPQARVNMLPVKAGFVGADTVAVALALNADQVTEPTLMVDLGTNGEIILATPDDILCCSTAAGPAFEGGHIRCGMRAAPGAVDSVRVSDDDLAPTLSVIGEGPPLGICGSGLVSLVSELIRTGTIMRSGAFDREHIGPYIRKGTDGLEYILALADRSAADRDLVLTHRDVSQLQLAKAAIHAGTSLMMAEMGVTRLSRVLLAGAFGNYLDPVAACGINMFPGVDPQNVGGVGNAAGAGAIMALISQPERARARILAQRMRYLELAAHPDFKNAYVEGITFTP
jgi:uncharacterized 2Fe-2S/4Fe-4S cluster protein (DUF4445 family)